MLRHTILPILFVLHSSLSYATVVELFEETSPLDYTTAEQALLHAHPGKVPVSLIIDSSYWRGGSAEYMVYESSGLFVDKGKENGPLEYVREYRYDNSQTDQQRQHEAISEAEMDFEQYMKAPYSAKVLDVGQEPAREDEGSGVVNWIKVKISWRKK